MVEQDYGTTREGRRQIRDAGRGDWSPFSSNRWSCHGASSSSACQIPSCFNRCIRSCLKTGVELCSRSFITYTQWPESHHLTAPAMRKGQGRSPPVICHLWHLGQCSRARIFLGLFVCCCCCTCTWLCFAAAHHLTPRGIREFFFLPMNEKPGCT
jgi:hypothetical protein